MARIRLDIAYDGTRFAGWARQRGLRTVQGELEAALERLYGRPVTLTVAGRTDAGVHATGQVASFEAPAPGREVPEAGAAGVWRDPATLWRALNALTGDDVAVAAASVAADDFDARRSARSRRYRYRLLAGPTPDPFERRYALHWPHRLDREALEACAALLVGSHDFTAFTPTDSEHVRFERNVLDAAWTEQRGGVGPAFLDAAWTEQRGDVGPALPDAAWTEQRGGVGAAFLAFEIEADAFMRNMVRALVGTMLEVASGRREVDDFARLLEGRPRPEGGETAPARGLFLVGVRY